MTKLISHVLASGIGCCVTEWAQSISLCHVDGQIPLLIHMLQLLPPEYLKATFIITLLWWNVRCPQSTLPVLVINMISWSKD